MTLKNVKIKILDIAAKNNACRQMDRVASAKSKKDVLDVIKYNSSWINDHGIMKEILSLFGGAELRKNNIFYELEDEKITNIKNALICNCKNCQFNHMDCLVIISSEDIVLFLSNGNILNSKNVKMISSEIYTFAQSSGLAIDSNLSHCYHSKIRANNLSYVSGSFMHADANNRSIVNVEYLSTVNLHDKSIALMAESSYSNNVIAHDDSTIELPVTLLEDSVSTKNKHGEHIAIGDIKITLKDKSKIITQ